MFKKLNEKKPLVIAASILLVVLLGFVGFLVFNKINASVSKSKAEDKLSELSDKFYEHYYDTKKEELSDEELKKFLSGYSKDGLIINLENLQLFLDSYNIEDYSVFDKCDKSGTKVMIFPVDPYGKKDYKKSFTLNCNF
ncbi:MAG: hypothetical protein IJH20_05465 [Bacilli bacterium]|nr:hypothetical protein [Bacilli bacterium]